MLFVLVLGVASRIAGVLQAPGVATGTVAPTTTGANLDGEPFDVRALRGGLVFANFWASWCAPCRHELPALAAAAHAHPDVRFVGFIVGGSAAEAQALVTETGVTYENVVLDAQSLAAWNVSVIPSSVLLDARGHVVWARGGLVNERDVARAIAEHANSSTNTGSSR